MGISEFVRDFSFGLKHQMILMAGMRLLAITPFLISVIVVVILAFMGLNTELLIRIKRSSIKVRCLFWSRKEDNLSEL